MLQWRSHQLKSFAQEEYNKIGRPWRGKYKVSKLQSHEVFIDEGEIPNRVACFRVDLAQISTEDAKKATKTDNR